MIGTPPFGDALIMSDNLATETKSNPASIATRNGPTDFHVLAQVEKWMAMIREINREQHAEPKYRS